MKALEKDRTRRYETANGLAMDIRRYLANEPVVARPPTTAYRAQKLVRRNKLVFAAVGAVALALTTGLSFSTWSFLRERKAHAGELALHFSRAHTFAPKAIRYLNAAGRAALQTYANREAAAYLAAALQQIDESGEDAPERDEIIRSLARARQRLGDYDGALELWSMARRKAIEANDLSQLASIEHRMGLACYWSGRYDDALVHYASSAVLRRLGQSGAFLGAASPA